MIYYVFGSYWYENFPEIFVEEFENEEKAIEFAKKLEINQYCKVYKVVCGEALKIV